MRKITVAFEPRVEPLEPVAAIGSGPVARSLASRLLRYDEAELRRLRGVAGPTDLIVFGAGTELPWVDGIVYLGRDSAAPSLLVPTTSRPRAPMDVVDRAIRRRANAVLQRGDRKVSPVVILLNSRRILTFAEALPLEPRELEAWLETATC
jgi:hypothetical protein